MKMLVINGSPRTNGRTAAALDIVSERMSDTCQIERIELGRSNISHCSGCRTCKETGECVIEDDMTQLYSKIRSNDMIIFASPVYFGAETGLFKNFLDRMYAMISYKDGEHVPNMGALRKASILLTCDSPDGGMKYGNVAVHLMSVLRYMGITDTSSAILSSASDRSLDDLTSYIDEIEFQVM